MPPVCQELHELQAARQKKAVLKEQQEPVHPVDPQLVDPQLGDRVRVRPDVATPRFDWGLVKPLDVGQLVVFNGDDALVDFPRQTGWRGKLSELERVEPAPPSAARTPLRAPLRAPLHALLLPMLPRRGLASPSTASAAWNLGAAAGAAAAQTARRAEVAREEEDEDQEQAAPTARAAWVRAAGRFGLQFTLVLGVMLQLGAVLLDQPVGTSAGAFQWVEFGQACYS